MVNCLHVKSVFSLIAKTKNKRYMSVAMGVALFGRKINDEDIVYVQTLVADIEKHYQCLWIYTPLFEIIKNRITFSKPIKQFLQNSDIKDNCSIVISLGGDGTLLDTLPLVLNTDISVLGVNIGHLGFLTSVSREEISSLIEEISKGCFEIEEHSLLQTSDSYALNEVTLRSAKAGQLLDISVWIDKEFLATYSSDGIIIATPTGSTAYNMSAGGPIISPRSSCLCITPICPHNLTSRPIVIDDNSRITLKVSGGVEKVAFSMDSYCTYQTVPFERIIKKADKKIKLIRMNNQSFFSAIREKLMWTTYLRKG